jgi:hypothetical protein
VDETPNLGLPYIMAAQSQKHVTHNEAIRALDALVQLSVLDRDLTAPPGSPAEGARYIVAASPTGAWSGHAGKIAAYQDGAWAFYEPLEGFIAWVADENAAVVWDGSAWTALTTGGAGSFSTVGVNATADATNKLSVAAAATLLNHAGAGHQLKLNKASASDTASMLYQDAFSGRAELGLTGDDDFHFKVSADGSTGKEAIVIDRSTGVTTFPLTPRREVLSANRTYYVRTDGSDANSGLANTSGGAFLTIQKAIDIVAALDLSIYSVSVNVAAGTYTGTIRPRKLTGAGTVTFTGDVATPANCVLSVASSTIILISVSDVSGYTFTGFKSVSTGGGGTHIAVSAVSEVRIGAWQFGTTASGSFNHIDASNGGTIFLDANYAISGGAGNHMIATGPGSKVIAPSRTVTLTGTPAFATAYANAFLQGHILHWFSSFSGSATGVRYNVSYGALILTFGGGANYFPGNSAGVDSTGGSAQLGYQ